MGKTSPTARSLQRLRAEGYVAEKVEQRLPRGFVTKDLFGCIDVVAVRPGEVLGVQATSAANTAARVKKALATPGLRAWLESGSRFEVWGWRKVAKTGRWEINRRVLTIGDLVTHPAEETGTP